MTVLNRGGAVPRLGSRIPDRIYAGTHLVWPPLPAYLRPTTGIASTPGTADMAIDGPVRITMRMRADEQLGVSDRPLLGQWATTPNTWFLMARATGLMFGITDINAVRVDHQTFNVAQLQAATPIGEDVYIGVHHRPSTVGASTRSSGIVSTDGVTWTTVQTSSAPNGVMPRATTAATTVGSHGSGTLLNGRIYWAQMEAVERARLVFPGAVGNYLSVPDAANLDITGDIEIVARVTLNDWTPAAQGAVVGKWTTTGNQRSYAVHVLTSGAPLFVMSTAGNNFFQDFGVQPWNATPAIPTTDGATLWLKVTRVQSSGLTSFFWAADSPGEPASWSTAGTKTIQAGAAMFSGTAPLEVGAIGTGASNPFGPGRIRRLIVRNGIGGTKVFDLTENDAGVMSGNTFTAASGQTVTVNGNVVQPQPNTLIWRFDANEHDRGTSWTDARGRTWTLSAGGAVVHPT